MIICLYPRECNWLISKKTIVIKIMCKLSFNMDLDLNIIVSSCKIPKLMCPLFVKVPTVLPEIQRCCPILLSVSPNPPLLLQTSSVRLTAISVSHPFGARNLLNISTQLNDKSPSHPRLCSDPRSSRRRSRSGVLLVSLASGRSF